MKLNELIAEFGDYEIKDLDAVKAMLERPKPKTVHDLKVGDMYWVLVAQGEVSEKRFFDDGFDNGFIKQGKAFLTEEEGIKQAKHDEIEAEFNVRPAFFRDAATEDEIEILTEQGIKEQWVEFLRKNLFVDVTKKVEEKVADSAGELDPTPLEVMAMFGIDESFTIGKVIECIYRKDFESAKKYESQINDLNDSVPVMVEVLRGWNLSCQESLFFLDFFKDNSRRELGDFDEIEALRYIAEKGAVMEHKNVSNDDNR